MTHEAAIAAPTSAGQTLPVRLGVIDYLNVVPVYDWLLHQSAESSLPGIETAAGTPAQMNRALLSGAIDISNVSSVAFGEHADEWLLLPHLSVAAHGRVDSVLLFSWHDDWRALNGHSIALTDHSATSVALVKLLAERRYGIQPRYVTQPSDLDAMLAEHDAALLIGDSCAARGLSAAQLSRVGASHLSSIWRPSGRRGRGCRSASPSGRRGPSAPKQSRPATWWDCSTPPGNAASPTWIGWRARRRRGWICQWRSVTSTCGCWIMTWVRLTSTGCATF